MAWIPVFNNKLWEYNDSPPDPGEGSALRPLWLQQTGGVRTHPISGREVYTNVRRVGSTSEDMGELSKTFWDAQPERFVELDNLVMELRILADDLTFIIPTKSNTTGFDATIDWGDGTVTTAQTFNSVGFTHVYAVAGTYNVEVSGTMPNIRFNSSGVHRNKLMKVTNLGKLGWDNLANAFYGCGNMTEFTAGNTDTSEVRSMYRMLRNCKKLTTINCLGFDTGKVTTMESMFFNTPLTQDYPGLSTFDINALNSADSLTNFMSSPSEMTEFDYEGLMFVWWAQVQGGNNNLPTSGVVANFGESQIGTSNPTAIASRANLIANFGWTIYDGELPDPNLLGAP